MITLENLLWLRDTHIGEVSELFDFVLQDKTDAQREKYLQDLWESVMIMRHAETVEVSYGK